MVKSQAEEALAMHAPNDRYCQKPPDSTRVATKAAAYESTAAKLAKRKFRRILPITFGHPGSGIGLDDVLVDPEEVS
jgi:hypothetical protein